MSAVVKYQPPFGVIEQRGLEYMTLARLDPLHRHLFTCLCVRADKRTREVRDRIDTMAEWSGMSSRKVQQGLVVLRHCGLINRQARGQRDPGGRRGHAWVWRTTVMPYELWSPEPLVRIISTVTAYVSTFYPQAKERARSACSSPKRTHGTTEEHAQTGGRARTATRDNPDTYPEDYPEGLTNHSEDTGVSADDVVRLAEKWVAERLARSLERFTDAVAVRWLRDAVTRAVVAGCTEADIDVALRQHVTEKFADPRQFDDWAARARDDRLFTDREQRRAKERFRRECEHDERVIAERAKPGYAERIATIVAETKEKLSMPKPL